MKSFFPSGNLGKQLKSMVKMERLNTEKTGVKGTALQISLALLLEMSGVVLQIWVVLVSRHAKERQVSQRGFKLPYGAFRLSQN